MRIRMSYHAKGLLLCVLEVDLVPYHWFEMVCLENWTNYETVFDEGPYLRADVSLAVYLEDRNSRKVSPASHENRPN